MTQTNLVDRKVISRFLSVHTISVRVAMNNNIYCFRLQVGKKLEQCHYFSNLNPSFNTKYVFCKGKHLCIFRRILK